MRLHTSAIKLLCAAALLATVTVSRPAAANPGLRGGVTSQPDTLFLGFQYDALISRGRSLAFVIQPAVDVGFNDNLFLVRGTAHFAFWIPVGRSPRLYLYPLIGVSGTYYNYKDPGGDSTGIGMDLGFGMRINQFGFEFWGSFRDAPDLTLAFSISF